MITNLRMELFQALIFIALQEQQQHCDLYLDTIPTDVRVNTDDVDLMGSRNLVYCRIVLHE